MTDPNRCHYPLMTPLFHHYKKQACGYLKSKWILYAHRYNLLLITNHSWILIVHKDFSKKMNLLHKGTVLKNNFCHEYLKILHNILQNHDWIKYNFFKRIWTHCALLDDCVALCYTYVLPTFSARLAKKKLAVCTHFSVYLNIPPLFSRLFRYIVGFLFMIDVFIFFRKYMYKNGYVILLKNVTKH